MLFYDIVTKLKSHIFYRNVGHILLRLWLKLSDHVAKS